MGWQVSTIDIADPNSDYKNVSNAIFDGSGHHGNYWDTVHITTPNHTHFDLADTLANYTDIVFVEKPGVKDAQQWATLLNNNNDTRIMMVKNNQYRDNIHHMAECANPKLGVTRINWINDNRVPKPGSWFTNKNLAFGGVSRDLMPHLLSLYQMFEPDWRTTKPKWAKKERRWNLEDLTDSSYGEVDPDGIYLSLIHI